MQQLLIFFYAWLVHIHPQAEAPSNCAACAEITQTYSELSKSLTRSSFSAEIKREPNSLRLICLTTPASKNAIGVVQQMHIEAPLARVAAVLENFSEYVDLFPDLIKVEAHPTATSGDIDVKFTEKAPFLLMGNPVHELKYQISSDPGRKLYRTSLKESRHLKYSEGQIALVADGDAATWYSEIDFYDADWGWLAEQKIWNENVLPIAQSDLAVKLKAETPTLAAKAVRTKAKETLDQASIKTCLKDKSPFSKAKILASYTPAPKK